MLLMFLHVKTDRCIVYACQHMYQETLAHGAVKSCTYNVLSVRGEVPEERSRHVAVIHNNDTMVVYGGTDKLYGLGTVQLVTNRQAGGMDLVRKNESQHRTHQLDIETEE